MRAFYIALVLTLFTSVNVYACKCAALDKVTKATMLKYDIVFTGKVLAISGDDEVQRVQFSVDELYKGESYPAITLEHNPSTDCSFSFAPGETWTIYGVWKSYGVPTTNFCTHTRRQPVTGADDFEDETRGKYAIEVQYLRDSIGVQQYIDPEAHKDQLHKNELPGPALAFGYLAAGLIGLAIIFYIVKRMFRRDGK